jgi:aminotransferase in exopolysaccharide biosynthesis
MIALTNAVIAGNEWKYVKECLDTTWISSAGKYVTQFEQMVAKYAGAKYGIACMNGSAGLHLCQMILGIGQDDYVLVPNITFIATLNTVKYTGASPIMIDVLPDTWQMDTDLLEEFLVNDTILKDGELRLKSDNRRIKAIMPVHVLGNMTEMSKMLELAALYHLDIIEDSTEALGSYYKGKHAGTFGKFGVFSFNGNKIISTGGGGVIVTDDEELAKKAKHLTTQAKTSRIDYIHDEIGYNYRLVNILAAVGVAQMEQLDGFIQRKKEVNHFYRTELKDIGDIVFQKINEHIEPNCWLFTFSTSRMRELLDYLNSNGVQCRPFWMPMNQLQMFKDDLYVTENDNAAKIYDSCISIPCSSDITNEDLKTVVEKIKTFYSN